jgi:hypothetical protein
MQVMPLQQKQQLVMSALMWLHRPLAGAGLLLLLLLLPHLVLD